MRVSTGERGDVGERVDERAAGDARQRDLDRPALERREVGEGGERQVRRRHGRRGRALGERVERRDLSHDLARVVRAGRGRGLRRRAVPHEANERGRAERQRSQGERPEHEPRARRARARWRLGGRRHLGARARGLELAREVESGRRPFGGSRRDAPGEDRVELGRRAGDARGRGKALAADRRGEVHEALAGAGLRARQELEEDQPERVDVGARVDPRRPRRSAREPCKPASRGAPRSASGAASGRRARSRSPRPSGSPASSKRTFSGLRSRWTSPTWWQRSSARASFATRRAASPPGWRPRVRSRSAERAAGHEVHDEPQPAGARAGLVDRDDAAPGRARQALGLAAEAGRRPRDRSDPRGP